MLVKQIKNKGLKYIQKLSLHLLKEENKEASWDVLEISALCLWWNSAVSFQKLVPFAQDNHHLVGIFLPNYTVPPNRSMHPLTDILEVRYGGFLPKHLRNTFLNVTQCFCCLNPTKGSMSETSPRCWGQTKDGRLDKDAPPTLLWNGTHFRSSGGDVHPPHSSPLGILTLINTLWNKYSHKYSQSGPCFIEMFDIMLLHHSGFEMKQTCDESIVSFTSRHLTIKDLQPFLCIFHHFQRLKSDWTIDWQSNSHL